MVSRSGSGVDRWVGAVLATGVVLSLAILIWGAVLYLLNPGAAEAPRTVLGIFRGAVELNSTATINLGLLVLLSTPVVRIIAAGIAFTLERSYKFALISLGVLSILTISIMIGYISGRS